MRPRTGILACVVVMLTVAVPGVQAFPADAPVNAGPRWAKYERTYLDTRARYRRAFGLQAAGRNIVRDGYREASGDVHSATRAEAMRSVGAMRGALHPPELAPADESYMTDTAAVYSSPPANLAGIAACESGGDYNAVDSTGTYWGAFQFDAGTWASVSDAPYGSASPAEQDAAAAELYAERGAAPWPVCGAG